MKTFEERFPDSKNNSGSQITIARKEGWDAALEAVFEEEIDNILGKQYQEWLEEQDFQNIKNGLKSRTFRMI